MAKARRHTARTFQLGVIALGVVLFVLAAPQVIAQSPIESIGKWKLDYEQRLGRAIEEMLEPLVGQGKVRAEVAAELDPERVSVSSEVVDPDSQVPKTVRTIEEGARSDTTTTYEFSKTVKSQARDAGQIKRLSIAVLVDGVYPAGEFAPRPTQEIEQLDRLVRSAVGFNAERGDKIEFISMRFAELPPRASRPSLAWGLNRAELLRLSELLILSVAVLLALLLLLRAVKTRGALPAPALARMPAAMPASVPAPMPVPAAEPKLAREPALGPAAPKRTVWDKLGQVNEAALAGYLRNEYPQTVALVLSRIEPAHAAKVIAALPEPFAADVVARMLRLEPVQQDVLNEVESTLAAQFATHFTRSAGGDPHETVARIMERLDRAVEGRIIGALERQNRDGAERVRSRMLSFDDLGRLAPDDARRLLAAVPADKLAVALKGASETIRGLFIVSLPERSGRILRDEIANLGPVRLSEVDDAQAAVLAAAKELAARGEIDLQGRG